jgi:hypothetical protein
LIQSLDKKNPQFISNLHVFLTIASKNQDDKKWDPV